MISKEVWLRTRDRALSLLRTANIVLTQDELDRLEVADFGLGRLEEIGLEINTYVNTDRVCAKEIIMFPWQICPEHMHPSVGSQPGKEETFRCRWGEVYLFIPGETSAPFLGRIPADKAECFTVKHQVVLHPGEQYTLHPETHHWFQAGPQGAIVSEFSTHSTDEYDIFTDPAIKRAPEVGQ
jgi:D-lyxose ketol-isomerase